MRPGRKGPRKRVATKLKHRRLDRFNEAGAQRPQKDRETKTGIDAGAGLQ